MALTWQATIFQSSKVEQRLCLKRLYPTFKVLDVGTYLKYEPLIKMMHPAKMSASRTPLYILAAIILLSFALLIFVGVPSNAQQAADQSQPEEQVPLKNDNTATSVRGKDWMIAVANPHAAEAGAKILREGGNAIDAMVAVQLTLGLVEPQSSGLGGGGFLLYWDSKNSRLHTFDGRETAPKNINPKLFLDENGKPLKFFDAVVSGISVGVPGLPKLLYETHQRFGSKPWGSLFDHPMDLAKNGFKISPRLAGLIERRRNGLRRFETTRTYFMDANGKPKRRGTLLKNPAYGHSLSDFKEKGASVFYTGRIARQIVEAVQKAKARPGTLSLGDLAGYRIKERTPVCSPYRGHTVCGMGPPSSGAIAVGQILGALEPFDLKALGPDNPNSWQLFGDATRLAFADRGRYVADDDFVVVPTKGLLAEDYLKTRASLLQQGARLKQANPGQPAFDHALNYADDEALELPSTTHFTIRDKDGNIVSMTTTIESAFGSNLMAGGFLLNNQLTDFSFRTHVDDRLIANSAAPGKRPRSSMAPTIVFKDNEPVLALGSPGGSRIIPYVAKSIIAAIDWDMPLQEAFDLPHVTNRFGSFALEANTKAVEWQAPLEAMGYRTVVISLNSGLHGIAINDNGLEGAADKRREGVVVAE